MVVNKRFFLIVAGISLTIRLFSQQSFGGIPFAFQKNINTSIIPVYGFPLVNNVIEKIKADSITKATCTTCDNNYYGKGLNTSIDIKNSGQLLIQDDSSKVWILKIESSTAYGMQFYFDKFKLPDNATLFIYNQDSSMILGAYTSKNNPADESKTIKFGTQIISGYSIIIEYWEPNNADFEGELRIANVIHIFEPLGTTGGPFGTSLPCQRNINCESSAWFPERNAVVLILGYDENTELSAWCTGSIINNTSENGRVLLLTTYHCIRGTGSMYNYSNWTFLFNHQGDCTSDGSNIPGYTGQSIFGSLMLTADADYNASDYLLLDLNASKQTIVKYGGCYAGWDRSETLPGNASTPVVMIHHPNGDIKKISKSVNKPITAPCANGDYWLVNWVGAPDYPYWGPHELGSSGAPLFNSEHRIVGQLFGGNFCDATVDVQDCVNPQYSSVGKFYKSWNHSGANGFAFYLDPDNTGQTSTNTYCPSNSSDPNGPGSGGVVSCYDPIDKGMKINENLPGIVPCIDLPIVLKPIDCYWSLPYSFKTFKCDEVENASLCSSIFGFNCRCVFVYYFIEIAEVNNYFVQVGNAYSKWFADQYDASTVDELSSPRSYSSITVDQTKLNEINISLKAGKLYRIKLAANQGGWKEAVGYFRMNLTDISYSHTNLVSSWPSYGVGNTDDFIDFVKDNTFVFNPIGRNVSLDNVTTINYVAPVDDMTLTASNINISASNSITITNSVINSDFVAAIIDIACAQGRMANPNSDEEQTNSEKNYNERVVHYNSNPGKNETFSEFPSSKNKSDTVLPGAIPSILLVPNPSYNGKFTLSSPIPEFANYEIVVFNLLGEKIYQSRILLKDYVIDLSAQPKGTYFVQISNIDELTVQKIVYQ